MQISYPSNVYVDILTKVILRLSVSIIICGSDMFAGGAIMEHPHLSYTNPS